MARLDLLAQLEQMALLDLLDLLAQLEPDSALLELLEEFYGSHQQQVSALARSSHNMAL